MLLTSYHEDYKELGIIDGVNCLTYSNPLEMIEKARYAIKEHTKRDEIGLAGYNLVKNRHTYKHRAERILEMIK